MKKLSQEHVEILAVKVDDTTLPMSVRKDVHEAVMDSFMNPKEDFDPATFDPKEGVESYEVKKRERIAPDRRLPTLGLLPKRLLEGQMVGMFESKQDLYLLMAYYINDLLDRIEELEKKVP